MKMQVTSLYIQALEFFGGVYILLLFLCLLLCCIELSIAKGVAQGILSEERDGIIENNGIYHLFVSHRNVLEGIYIVCANFAPVLLSAWMMIVFGFPNGIGAFLGWHFIFGYMMEYHPLSLEKSATKIYERTRDVTLFTEKE